MDQINFRSSHHQPTPRGGGIAVGVTCVASAIALVSASAFFCFLPLALPLAVVGLLDDRHNLPALWRYGVQLFISALILGLSPLPQGLIASSVSGIWFLLPSLVFLVISVSAIINFTNFMDGLDGLVAGCMTVAIAALSFSINAPWSLWTLVGSLLGFLFFNWSPAKVFMGDVGSTFLGAVFAGLVLHASDWTEALGYLLLATPLLLDASLCVIRRLFAGQRVFQAHRLHLFQRLYQAGWPHSRVSLSYIAATAFLAVAMLAGGLFWVFILSFLELLFGFWLDQHVAVPFVQASKS